MAVFGNPFWMASSTFFHWASWVPAQPGSKRPNKNTPRKKDHQSPCHDSFLLDFWPNAVLGASGFSLCASARQQTIRDRRRFATVFVFARRKGKTHRKVREELNRLGYRTRTGKPWRHS